MRTDSFALKRDVPETVAQFVCDADVIMEDTDEQGRARCGRRRQGRTDTRPGWRGGRRRLEAITGALKKGDEVKIVGFGTFVVTDRPAGEARNPRTGEKIKIPASKAPKFRAGAGLKDAVNAK